MATNESTSPQTLSDGDGSATLHYWWREEEAARNAWKREPRRWLRLLKGAWAAISSLWLPIPLSQERMEALERSLEPRDGRLAPPPPSKHTTGL